MSKQHEPGEHAPMVAPKTVVTPPAPSPPQEQQVTERWEPKEHRERLPAPEATAQYEREYVYGSHLQPGLERSPTYLTPRERAIEEGKGPQLYEQSLEQRSGILVRAEERSIAEQQYQERLSEPQARGVQGPVSFEEMSEKAWDVAVKSDAQLRGLVERQVTSKHRTSEQERPLSRWSELKDFGQDIANVKANAGTSSLSRTILGLQSQVPEVVKKYGIIGLGSPTAGLIMGGYEVAAFESLINPYAPGLVEGLTSGKQALVGTLVGEAALMVIGGKVFSWMVKGTPNPLKVKSESWLSGSYEEAAKIGELWKPSVSERIVMKVTGAKPQLSYGEVSIPVVETVSKAGSVLGVPSGAAFTDIGWEVSMAPRMGGVMVTKWPTVTTTRALELFFGIGEELIPFGAIKGEGEPLGFQKPKAEPVTIEKGLPPSTLEESYYPKIGGFDVSLKDVNVREVTSWPTTRSLMEEQKLLPFVTQTQVTRMGIFPYVPDMAVGETSKSLGSAFLVGLGASLIPKAFSQTRQEQKATLPSLPKLEPLIKLKQPTFEEPFEIQKLKLGPSLIPAQKEKQRTVPLVTVGLGLESLTEAVSVQSSALGTEQIQEPLQVQSLAQIQKQMQKQVQSLASQFKTPSLQKQATTFHLPTEASLKRKGKKRVSKKQGQGLYLWEFPILDPEKVWKLK